MHFEDLVLSRIPHLGQAYRKTNAHLTLLWSTYSHYDRLQRLTLTNNPRVREAILDLAGSALLFATKGDPYTNYEPEGNAEEFLATLDPDFTVTFPPLQITYCVAEIQLCIFLPFATSQCWYRSQHLFLLCEHQYITMYRKTLK